MAWWHTKLTKIFGQRKMGRPRVTLQLEALEDRLTPASPAITSISPSAGPLTGGTVVTIMGTDLGSATVIDFGTNTPATATPSIDTPEQMVVAAPAGTIGIADITVTNGDGTSATSTADQFTYAA